MELVYETLTRCPSCGGGTLTQSDAQACLARCEDCGLRFDNPRPDADSISTFYSRQGQYDGWLSNLPARRKLWLRRWNRLRAHLPAGGRILDVGAGIGQFLSLSGEGWEVDGTELSPVARRIASERWGISLREGQLEDLRLPDAAYDVVTLFHVLEHVPQPGTTLREILRILKPGGCAVFAVPDEWGATSARAHRFLARFGAGLTNRGRDGIRTIHTKPSLGELHLSRFRPSSLRQALVNAGFEVVLLEPDPHHPPGGLVGLLQDLSWNLSRVAMRLKEDANLHPAILAIARKHR